MATQAGQHSPAIDCHIEVVEIIGFSQGEVGIERPHAFRYLRQITGNSVGIWPHLKMQLSAAQSLGKLEFCQSVQRRHSGWVYDTEIGQCVQYSRYGEA